MTQDSGSVLPAISNLPFPRNPHFTGRDSALADLHKAFHSGKNSHCIQVVYGVAGTGKTQLANEYAYRYAADYGVIWWVPSEEPASLASSFGALAGALGQHIPPEATLESTCRAVRHALGRRTDWLLIFDNANAPIDLEDYLPVRRNGHCLITSRNPSWRGVAEPQPLRGLKREDSIQFLRRRTGNTDPEEVVQKLAKALDDLPLALEQAVSLMEQERLTFAQYLKGYEDQYGLQIGARRASSEYGNSAALSWEMSYARLKEAAPDAACILNLCAFLSTDDIPRTLLRSLALSAPDSLNSTLNNILKFEEMLEALRRFALIETSEKSLSIHRSGAAMARDRMEVHEREYWAGIALAGVALLFEFDSQDLQTWSKCARILPHALTVTGFAHSLGVDPTRTALLLNDIGRYLHKRAQLNEAKDALERSHALTQQVFGKDHPKVSAVSNNLGRVLTDLGQRDEAMKHYQQSLEIDQATYGADDPKVATVINNFAKSLYASGDIETSKKQFEWALSVYEQHYGPDHPKVGAIINNLGYVLRQSGDHATAVQHFERALNLVETRYGQQHPHVATVYHNLGQTLREMGEHDRAREHLEKALAIDEAVYGPHHPSVARDLDQLGQALQAANELTDAREVLERSLRITESLHGLQHASIVPRLRLLAQLAKHAGETDRANEYLDRANRLQVQPKEASAPAP